jgi:hypothetical protein
MTELIIFGKNKRIFGQTRPIRFLKPYRLLVRLRTSTLASLENNLKFNIVNFTKQSCEEHNSFARHAELVSASPKAIVILTELPRDAETIPNQVQDGMTAKGFSNK